VPTVQDHEAESTTEEDLTIMVVVGPLDKVIALRVNQHVIQGKKRTIEITLPPELAAFYNKPTTPSKG